MIKYFGKQTTQSHPPEFCIFDKCLLEPLGNCGYTKC